VIDILELAELTACLVKVELDVLAERKNNWPVADSLTNLSLVIAWLEKSLTKNNLKKDVVLKLGLRELETDG
jgi:hypothetical protein